MNPLLNFSLNKLKITWQLLLLGFKGHKNFAPQVNIIDIQSFAQKKLTKASDWERAILRRVLKFSDDNKKEIVEQLELLAFQEKSRVENELRKWRVVLLQERLKELEKQKDPIMGFVQLSDFWESFDFPYDSPFTSLDAGDDASLEEYYTIENYHTVLRAHRDWLVQELQELREKDLCLQAITSK